MVAGVLEELLIHRFICASLLFIILLASHEYCTCCGFSSWLVRYHFWLHVRFLWARLTDIDLHSLLQSFYALLNPTASPSSPPSSSSSSSHAQSSCAPSSSADASANASRQPFSRVCSTLHTGSISVVYTISERNQRCGIHGSRGRVERKRTAGGILWCVLCHHRIYIYFC